MGEISASVVRKAGAAPLNAKLPLPADNGVEARAGHHALHHIAACEKQVTLRFRTFSESY